LDRASASGAEGRRFKSCLAYWQQETGKHFFKEVSINFRTRIVGMFEIAEPVLEGDEVFDSNLLKQTIESMITAGRRNVCVDLSQLDYLYSDTINALVVMNKRMLDVFGRLSLLAPQPPVMEILKKGGIQNILKIFIDENEILQLSQQMSGQAMPAPAAAFPPPQPQSEFDSLRSEIGSAFEYGPGTAGMPAPAPQPYAPQAFGVQGAGGFQQAPPPSAPPAGPGMPQRPPFAPPGARPSFGPPPPPATGAFPRYAPPPPRRVEPFPQKPPARGYTPPPPKPAAAPLATGGETRRMPPVPEAPVSLRPRIQPREEPAPAQSEEDLEKIEASLEKKIPAFEKHKPDFEEMEEPPKRKKGALAPMLVTLVVLAVAAGGSFYVYRNYFQNPPTAPAQAQKETPPPEPPELPVSEAPKEAAAEAPAPAVEEAASAVQPKPEQKKAEPLAPIKVVKKSTPEPAVKRSTPLKPVVKEQPQRRVIEEPEFEEEEPPPVVQRQTSPPPEEPVRPAPVVTPTPPAPTPTPPAPVPTPQAPTPEPVAGGEESTIFIGTLPPLADVYMDGKFIGKSSTELKVSPGTHTLRFVKGDKEFTKQFTFQTGKNPGTFVKLP
jgi:anti-anti-sigma regulatory factor/cytoskeletal protein RodZ